MTTARFGDLKGVTLTEIKNLDNEVVEFHTSDGRIGKLYHEQDCGESVTLQEVVGDLDDLLGAPLLEAEEVAGETGEGGEYGEDSWTWTFYKLATIKGSVTLRWLGTSNGFYSEAVDFAWSPAMPDG